MSLVTVYAPHGSIPSHEITAESNRKLLRDAGVRSVALAGGPGCGKTTLIDRSIDKLDPDVRVGVIVCSSGRGGDALKLNHYKKEPVVQLNLGSDSCPDSWLFRQALDCIELASIDLLLVECIGTLTSHPTNVGQDATAVMFSVAAGHDKPSKHPALTAAANAIVLCKTDLLPLVPFDQERFRDDVRRLNPSAKCFELSATQGDGLDAWVAWLRPPAKAAAPADVSHWFG